LGIVKKVLSLKPRQIRILDNRENALHSVQESLGSPLVRYLQGDVRDITRLLLAFNNVDIIFHAAALKHVHLCECNPSEAIMTNVIGTMNVIEAARENNVDRVVNISTDKAVNPINVLGTSKAMGEKLIVTAENYKDTTKFCNVRFGNVLGSSGSVLEMFDNDVVKVTDPNMTRFIMTIPQAVDLVLKAGSEMKGSETFILKMPAFKLGTLVSAMKKDGQEVKIVGKRAGERDYEILVSAEEMPHCYEIDDFYVITKAVQGDSIYVPDSNGTRWLTEKELKELVYEIN